MPRPAITCELILTSAATRADGSLGLRMATPELKPDEKTAFFELQNVPLKVLIQPMDEQPGELKDVKGEFDIKTPSQRLRATIFVWWKQQNEPGEFEEFYRKRMETLIDYVKDQLKPE